MDFFEITDSEREAMTAADSTESFVQPEPEYLPADYVLLNGSLAGRSARYTMGWGTPAIDTASAEYHGGTFKRGLIHYSFNGLVSVSVVKVALSYLVTKPEELHIEMKLPEKYRYGGSYYATTYNVSYDPDTKEHKIWLGEMVKR